MESRIAAYKDLVKSAQEKSGTGHSAINGAVDAIEPLFFNSMICSEVTDRRGSHAFRPRVRHRVSGVLR
jgi:hypothetical protein